MIRPTYRDLLFVITILAFCPFFSSPFLVSQRRRIQKPSPQQNLLPNHSYDDVTDESKFLRALCIVPPTEDWDRLQRARHYARDPAFHEWPPAIRLFHPFTATAFEIAEVIEELDIEPFEVELDTWVIIPNMEAHQAEMSNMHAAPSILDAANDINPEDDEDRRLVEELIASEEAKGREKYKARLAKGLAPKMVQEYSPDDDKKSPAEVLKEQQQQYEEFGGPCILCLEPSLESRQQLCDLREAIADVLQHDTYSSPSSMYSWSYVDDMDNMGYRPLIPISSFESLQLGLDVARRLKGLWGDTLKFRVNEFHLVSCKDDGGEDEEDDYAVGPQSLADWNKEPWMCNAKIMLMGEEMEQDDSINFQHVQELLEEGEPGGLDISNDFTILDDEEEEITDIEDWLDLDDDWDEGSTFVIGRTHFFTGEQRTYQGMPASSAIDAKDRAIGDAGSAVSGLARRRRTTSRQGTLWEEGEYGRRDSDYLPWTKRERKKKGDNLGLF